MLCPRPKEVDKMSMQGAATNSETDGAIRVRDSSPDLVPGGAASPTAEVDVLRNSLSAVMAEYHEQAKRFAADHARQSQEIAALTAQNLQLSRDLAALAVERDGLSSQRSELAKRLSDIESSTSWVATRRLRESFARHPRLRRLLTRIRRALARP
jgi:chromosome segregation ATPase